MTAWGYEFYLLLLKVSKFLFPRGHVISSVYFRKHFQVFFSIADSYDCIKTVFKLLFSCSIHSLFY